MDDWFDRHIDVESKTLFLGHKGADDDINQDSVALAIKGIHILDKVKPSSDLTVMLSCRGGDVEDGLALYSALRDCQSWVHIHVFGVAESMGSAIVQAGDKRTMADTAHMMLHLGSEAHTGHVEDVKRAIAHNMWLEDQLTDLYMKRIREVKPKISKSSFIKHIQFDRYFYKQDCIEWGLIDA
jgi:ATP-dependent protease ClpP protease subunit